MSDTVQHEELLVILLTGIMTLVKQYLLCKNQSFY